MERQVRIFGRAGSTVSRGIATTLVIWLFASVQAVTNEEDVYALQELYIALDSPLLTGWTPTGGDPCLENWQGVSCAGPNVTLLTLSGLSLTGGLGSALENLTALIVLDLSNNVLSGGLPLQLPPHVQQLILSANQFTGNLPSSLADLSNLVILNVSSNSLFGNIPDIFGQSGALNTLDFSNNDFDGSLPPSFGALTELNTLYLQNNQLSGTIDILSKLPLQTLDLSNNSFTGWIPSELKHFPSLDFTKNTFNTFPAPPPPPFYPPPPPSHGSTSQNAMEKPPSSKQTKKLGRYLTVGRLAGIMVAALLTVAVAVLVVLFFVWKTHGREGEQHDAENSWQGPLIPSRKEQKKESDSPKAKNSPKPREYKNSLEVSKLKPPPVENYRLGKKSAANVTKGVRGSVSAREYTISDLQTATQSFSHESLLGDGTLGKVYKAVLSNGTILAVKKLDYSITRMAREDFVKFLSRIARLRHPNITELVGYCVEHGEHLLVYDYIENGTLHETLHFEVGACQSLPWTPRVKIALGVARALEYLQEVCAPAVVHRNLTSVNILLDDAFNPHLSDCGLATLISLEEQNQASAERLEFSGYRAPEDTMSGIYTIKSDVYSFGVVMLELLTGRKPLDSSRPRSEQYLVRWAVPQLHDIDALAKMVDPALKGIYPVKSISRFADIIALCVQPEPEFRPPMSEVTQSLERLLQGGT